MAKLRLDKCLSHIGIGTRTEVKKLIKMGKVKVDGKVIKDPGFKADEKENSIEVSGERVNYKEFVYIMLNKPKGVISATEDKKDKTVLDLIDHPMAKHIFPVGRLDKDTTGLLLLTNDGELSHNLLSPKKHVDKTYSALVKGQIEQKVIKDFNEGITLEDGTKCMPASLYIDRKTMYNKLANKRSEDSSVSSGDKELAKSEIVITIKEGKFHQIKRMFEAVGSEVIELNRDSMGRLILDEQLDKGMWRELTEVEVDLLKGNK